MIYEQGTDFKMDYYLKTHMPLVQSKWAEFGLKSWKVCRGQDTWHTSGHTHLTLSTGPPVPGRCSLLCPSYSRMGQCGRLPEGCHQPRAEGHHGRREELLQHHSQVHDWRGCCVSVACSHSCIGVMSIACLTMHHTCNLFLRQMCGHN